MDTGVLIWWATLSCISAGNIAFWMWSVRALPPLDRTQGRHALLAGIFTFACAYRSVLPRAEATRICLYDSWISSASLARSVATIAELAFAVQCAMLLYDLSRAQGSRMGVGASWLIPFSIATAEVFSWYSALTTNYLGSVIEESIWAGTAALIALVLATTIRRLKDRQRTLALAALLTTLGYFTFMCTVDVPMYWNRYRDAESRGARYLSIGEGWRDAHVRRVVTWRYEDWAEEMPWMSLYFSVGVWLSIAFIRLSRSRPTDLREVDT